MSLKIYKKIIVCIILMFFCFNLTGCFDSNEVDNLSYVMAVGLDKGECNLLRITLQIALPTQIAGGGGMAGKSSMKEESFTITTIETTTIYSGLNMVNTYVSKQLNFSHAKLFVFSEELAREGIQQYINALIRGEEFRPNMFIVISKCNAEDYLNEVKPILEPNPAKYYEMNLEAYRYTGFTPNSTLINFYLQEECTCSQAVAALASISRYESSDEFDYCNSTADKKGREKPFAGDFIAGNLPKVGEVKAEVMGLAVFDGDRMVGELDGQETRYYMMVTGQYQNSYFTIPDPQKKNKFVILSVGQNKFPVKKVKMIEGKPHISLSLNLKADIISIQSGINYEALDNVEILEKSSEEFIKKELIQLIERTIKELKSDIFEFGKAMKPQFLTWDEWIDFNWLKQYEDSVINVVVDLKIKRPLMIIRTIPIHSSEGEIEE